MRTRPFPLLSVATAALILACSDGAVGPPFRDPDVHLKPKVDSLPEDTTKKPKKPKKPKPEPCDTLTDTTCTPPCDTLTCPPPCDTITCPPPCDTLRCPPPCDTLTCPPPCDTLSCPPPCDTLTCPPPCDTLSDTLCRRPDSLRIALRFQVYQDAMSRPGLRGLFQPPMAPRQVNSRRVRPAA